MSTIIINMLLEEYRKFLIAKPEETQMAMRTDQHKKRGKSKSGRTPAKFDGKCIH